MATDPPYILATVGGLVDETQRGRRSSATGTGWASDGRYVDSSAAFTLEQAKEFLRAGLRQGHRIKRSRASSSMRWGSVRFGVHQPRDARRESRQPRPLRFLTRLAALDAGVLSGPDARFSYNGAQYPWET